MIVSLRGRCLASGAEGVVVEVGGVGLLVTCTPSAVRAARIGEEVRLSTALIVREDGWSLYGFVDDDERGLFDQLQTVSGVGPRMALAAVGTLGAADLIRAIGAGDIVSLTAISGVGKKTAERIILELRDKVAALAPALAANSSTVGSPDVAQGWQRQVLDALVGLGWHPRDAEPAVRSVAAVVVADGLTTADVPALLRLALTRLDRV